MADDEIAEFREVATALRELETESLCRIVIQSPYQFLGVDRFVQFIVDHNNPRTQEILESHQLDPKRLQTVSGEVAYALSAVINGTGSRGYAQRRHQRAKSTTSVAELEQRYLIAEQTFDIPPLRARAWIKRTSKENIPFTLEWEVADKIADDGLKRPTPKPVRYGTLRLLANPPKYDPFSSPTQDFVLTVDREDVLVMLDILARLRDALDGDTP